MKFAIILISCLFVTLPLKAQVSEGNKILWNKTEIQFDTVRQGEKLRAIFVCYNLSDTTLVLESIQNSCGCMTSQVQKRRIEKKDSGYIIVDFNTNSKRGAQRRLTTVYTNQGFFELNLYAYIKRDDE